MVKEEWERERKEEKKKEENMSRGLHEVGYLPIALFHLGLLESFLANSECLYHF